MKNTLKILLGALMISAFPMLNAADGDAKAPASSDWSKPVLVEGEMPAYPEAARQRNIQGTVMVEALLMEDGRLIGAEVVQSVHPVLDRVALKAMAEWTFEPAEKDGESHWAVVRVPMRFALTPDPERSAIFLAGR